MDEALRQAVEAVFPGRGEITLLGSGWDSEAFALDGRIVIKRPRHAAAEARLRQEAAVLALVRPRVTLAVPDVHLVEGPPVWSWHEMVPGRQLLAADYVVLPDSARAGLARDLARFLAEVHGVAVPFAGRVQAWAGTEQLAALVPGLPEGLRRAAARVVAEYAGLPADPLGEVFGQFDTHGWNMAFDAVAGRLNGVFDFGDAGIGARHRDFIYCGLTSLDLMARVVGEYRALTGRAVDMGRVRTLAGAHRLWEWGEGAEADRAWLTRNFADWVAWG